jgi:peroxin-1
MLDQIAAETDGLSGADLQAMLYNAHLEVVQSSIAAWDVEKGIDGGVAEKAKDKGKSKGKGKAAENGGPVSDKPTVSSIFRQLAPVEELSRQERATMESRVSCPGLAADSC